MNIAYSNRAAREYCMGRLITLPCIYLLNEIVFVCLIRIVIIIFILLQDYSLISKLVSDLCKEISKQWRDKSNLVTLDIASGYHSYMFDISKNCKEKVCMHQSKHFVNCSLLNNTILIITVSTILANKKLLLYY